MTYTASNGMESEFRREIVSGDWVLIAAGRGMRPHAVKPRESNYQSPADCPFEDPQKSGNSEAVMVVPEGSNEWRIQVVKNKYPAVVPGACGPIMEREGFEVTAGVGFHEIIVMRDHDKFFPSFSPEETAQVLQVYRDRYRQIALEPCGQYIMIFHNYGHRGGASVYHPHSQIISVPIIPPDVMRSVKGSYDYFKKNGREAHAVMVEYELANKKRILFENEQFVAFCPFVSKQPYEMRIYPKFSSAHFDHIEDQSLVPLGEALNTVLKKMRDALDDPAYNFFIHTAPLHFEHSDLSFDQYYRWHIEVIPRVSFDAGFEAGTGIKINIIDPDVAAQTLNG
ncbi:MAG: DUF4921 family protein [Patescibacteria group bacterium]